MLLDLPKARSFFPQLDGELAYFENAGGSFMATPVADRMAQYMRSSPGQPAWNFEASKKARTQLDLGLAAMKGLIGASAPELVLSHSTTINVYVLAQALRATWNEGDAVVITDQDHEANRGAWKQLASSGIEIRRWPVEPETGELDLAKLPPLLDRKVRLVCVPHVSNVVGTINPIEEITALAHGAGARICVDGVAFAPHRRVDPHAWNVDFYLFSLYKVYGPHVGLMFARRDAVDALANQSHDFHAAAPTKKLNPGGQQYEMVAACAGVSDYFDALAGARGGPLGLHGRLGPVFDAIAEHEESLCAPVLEWLSAHDGVRLIGRASPARSHRVPTIAFSVDHHPAKTLADALAERNIATGASHFYAPQCLRGMGLDPEQGVLRVSMVHYNLGEEVERLIAALDDLIG